MADEGRKREKAMAYALSPKVHCAVRERVSPERNIKFTYIESRKSATSHQEVN